jgi:glycogen phosphorylase
MKSDPRIIYLSMGAFLEPTIMTYSGGLEILAGDTLRSCADLHVPVAGFILESKHGYCKQEIDENSWQQESYQSWGPKERLPVIDKTVTIKHHGRDLKVGAEVYIIHGLDGFEVPVYLLNSDVAGNEESDTLITNRLYNNDREIRIAQENILGQGGVKLARALGYRDITTFHMNEGHACLSTLELLAENGYSDNDVRNLCMLTTHTPIPAGHDVFMHDQVKAVVGDFLPWHIKNLAGNDSFNTTQLAASLSRSVNAVSRKHRDVCLEMPVFKGKDIKYVTNGVHSRTWTSQYFQTLFNAYIPEWKKDPSHLEKATAIPGESLLKAKAKAKRQLIEYINSLDGTEFRNDYLTIVWARRFTDYKRPNLLFKDIDALEQIAEKYGRLQLIFAGKAHCADMPGKNLIQEVIKKSKTLDRNIKCIFLPDYNPTKSLMLLAGADIWLNNPIRPLEASGTSGMKACHNGTINVSIADGWWVEAIERNQNAGWTIGPVTDQKTVNPDRQAEDNADYASLTEILPEILKLYGNKKEWSLRMQQSITLASYFNTHRMVNEYSQNLWNIS